MATKTDKKKKSKGRNLIGNFLGGRIVSASFLGRHWGVILAIVILVMIYITNRYQCILAMENIQHLESELQVVRSERIREKSYYMSEIRELAIQHRIDSLGLQLKVRRQPPFKIKPGQQPPTATADALPETSPGNNATPASTPDTAATNTASSGTASSNTSSN